MDISNIYELSKITPTNWKESLLKIKNTFVPQGNNGISISNDEMEVIANNLWNNRNNNKYYRENPEGFTSDVASLYMPYTRGYVDLSKVPNTMWASYRPEAYTDYYTPLKRLTEGIIRE